MKPWIFVSLHSETQEYQRAQASDARAAATRGGLEARVVYYGSEPSKQIQQLSEAIATPDGKRPVAIIAETAGSIGFEHVARSALEARVGWVLASDSPPYLEALHREFPDRLVSSACVNNEEMGRLLGLMVLALLPAGGKLLVMEGPAVAAATLQRRRGIEDRIRGSKIQIAKTLGSDWTAAGAERVTDAWLKLAARSATKPDLLLSLNDEMAVGVLQAIRRHRPDWGTVPAIGCDGLPEGGQRLVREGVLAATIIMPPTAGACVDLTVRSMHGEQVPILSSIAVRAFPSVKELTPRR